MLEILTGLLSSSGVGSIVGLVGGIINRKIDLQNKKLDQAHELQKMDKQKEYLTLEIQGKTEVATIEGEAMKEAASYKAMEASYSYAAPTSEDGWVGGFSKIVRPLLTLSFFFFTAYIFYQIHLLVKAVSPQLPIDDLMAIYKEVLQWFFFQAGISIGWWFAMRPGKVPSFGGK